MNTVYLSLLILLAAVLASYSQADTSDDNPPVTSLQLSAGRTQVNRVGFLIDVAQAYAKEGNSEAAISAYERILEIEPDHQQAKYLLSHIYIGTHQYRKAEALLLKLLEERPEDFTLLNNLAWVYATAEDPAIRNGSKSIRYAQSALVLAPYDHHVWSTLSEAYYVSGDYEKAYRAITHMAQLAMRSSQGITEEAVAEYNEQIRKCKRALDTANAMNGIE